MSDSRIENPTHETMPVPVVAKQLNERYLLKGPESRVLGQKGDWIISFPNGEQRIIAPEEFKVHYRKIGSTETAEEKAKKNKRSTTIGR